MHLRGVTLILRELKPYKEAQLEGVSTRPLTESIAQLEDIFTKLSEQKNVEVESAVDKVRRKLIEFQKSEHDDQAQSEPYNTVHLVLLILAKCWPQRLNRDKDGNIECPISQMTLTPDNKFITSLGCQFELQTFLNHIESESLYKKHDPTNRQLLNKRDLALAKAQAKASGITSLFEQQYANELVQYQVAEAKNRELHENYQRQIKSRLKKKQLIANFILTTSILLGIAACSFFLYAYGITCFTTCANLMGKLFFNSNLPISLLGFCEIITVFSASLLITIELNNIIFMATKYITANLLEKFVTPFEKFYLPPISQQPPLLNNIQRPTPPEIIQPAPPAYLKRVMDTLNSIGEDKPKPQAALEFKSSNAQIQMQMQLAQVNEAKRALPSIAAAELSDDPDQPGAPPLPMIDPNQQRRLAAREPQSEQSRLRRNFLNKLNQHGSRKAEPQAAASARLG